MKVRHLLLLGGAAAWGWLGAPVARADSPLSPELLDQYDRRGYFTPNFKAAIQDLVDANEKLAQANAEQKKFQIDLPGVLQQAAAAQAKTAALRQELAKYDHPDQTDFLALQACVNDPSAKPSDVIALAQAYVWTYPDSPNAAQAQQYLATWQKKLADAEQAARDATAAREAAHAELVRRAQAHDLTLPEWRDFLRGMSEDNLVQLFGQPTLKQNEYWYYDGAWIVNPGSTQKTGMQINFDAGRVIGVDPKSPSP